ncbi:MAG: FGGY family carbohydrate kinase [Chloroflexota bacterium]|nr:FGGY family carbohydrate kinase [Chloroflexota bacterium]
MTPLLVGLDVGTTNVKALVYEPDGRAVARASVPTPTHHPRPGWAFYRAEELWEQSAAALRRALAQVDDPRRVAAVAVASMGEAGVTLDAAGLPTGDVIAWFDTRSQPQADRLATLVGADELFARTGLSVQPIWSLCKMLWLREHEPDAWRRTVRWLNVADYVAHRLGGEPATGHSLASRTLALDVHGRRWDEELIRAAELDPALLPPLLPEGTAVGGVSPDVARLTGLPAGATIGVGGHDHLCGALAAGVTEPGAMLESLGTTDTMLLATDRPLTDPLLGRQGYSQGAHVVPDRWYVYGGQYTFGASIEWFLATFGGDGLDALIAEASSVPAGSHGVAFLPHLRLANPPHVDPASRGAFVGLSTFAGRPVLFRALLEGLGFEARNALDPLLALAGIEAPTDGRAIGGVTRNRLLMEIRASTRGAPIDVLDLDEATALGAAVLGGLAAGVYRDAPDALATLRYARTRVEPVAEDVPRYDRLYRTVHQRLYPALAPLSHALAAEGA